MLRLTETRQEVFTAPETMVSCIFITIFAFYHPQLCPDRNGSSTGGHWSRSSQAWWWQFTQYCIYINRKCRRGKSCLCKLGKKKAHALRAKSETCQKEETDFLCWDIAFHILAWFYFPLNISLSFLLYFSKKILAREIAIISVYSGFSTLHDYIAI